MGAKEEGLKSHGTGCLLYKKTTVEAVVLGFVDRDIVSVLRPDGILCFASQNFYWLGHYASLRVWARTFASLMSIQ